MTVYDKNEFYNKIYKYNELGLGETYIDGIWHSDNIQDVLTTFVLNRNCVEIPNLAKININIFLEVVELELRKRLIL